MAVWMSLTVTSEESYSIWKVVVGPVLPALHAVTPANFSTFAEIILRSVEQVMPLTLVLIVADLSETCVASCVVDCAEADMAEAKTKVIANTNMVMLFIVKD